MNPRRVLALFEPEVTEIIEKHTLLTNFKSENHARHRCYNMVYKVERKRLTVEMPEEVAKDKGSEIARMACIEWRKRIGLLK